MRALRVGCAAIGAIFVVLLMIGAWIDSTRESDTSARSSTTVTPTRSSPAREKGFVSRAEFGERWPLAVESGTLRCEPDYGSAIVIVVGSVKYALNGRARGQIDQTGWRDSRELIRKNEYGGLADVGPLIEAGMQLCR